MSTETTIHFVPKKRFIEIDNKTIIQTLNAFRVYDIDGSKTTEPQHWAEFTNNRLIYYTKNAINYTKNFFKTILYKLHIANLYKAKMTTIDTSDYTDLPDDTSIENIAEIYNDWQKQFPQGTIIGISQSKITPELVRVTEAYYKTFNEDLNNPDLWQPCEATFILGEHSYPDNEQEKTAFIGNISIGLSGYSSVYTQKGGDLDLLVSMIEKDPYFMNLSNKLETIWSSPVKIIADYSY